MKKLWVVLAELVRIHLTIKAADMAAPSATLHLIMATHAVQIPSVGAYIAREPYIVVNPQEHVFSVNLGQLIFV